MFEKMAGGARMLGRAVALVILFCAGPSWAEQVYFGNLHAHTSYSDGSGSPDEAFRQAKRAGLDFMAITEHNHDKGDGTGDRRDGKLIAKTPSLYSGGSKALAKAAQLNTRDGSFVALFGQEFSTISSGNHVNIFDVPLVIEIPNGDFAGLLTWIGIHPDSTGRPALLQFNHPRSPSRSSKDYGRDDFATEREWVEKMDPHVELIEVLNAPALKDGTGFRAHASEADYFRYLNLGFHVAPSVGHDNHYRNWGLSTDARVAVIANSLTKADVMSALRERHAYATEDKNLAVIFRANGALSGDITSPPTIGSELQLTLTLRDTDEPAARYRIDVFQDEPGADPISAPSESFEVSGDSSVPYVLDGVRFAGPGQFVLLRITQFSDEEHADDDRTWTAPVWFEFAAGPTSSPGPPSVRIVSIVPDPVGDDFAEEQITLRNSGTTPIRLTGWQVRDLADRRWSLDSGGELPPGAELTLKRNGQAMSMNNSGDQIELLDPTGTSVQVFKYDQARVGEVIPYDGIH